MQLWPWAEPAAHHIVQLKHNLSGRQEAAYTANERHLSVKVKHYEALAICSVNLLQRAQHSFNTVSTQFAQRIPTNFEPPSYQPPRSHALEANG
jgi:hypothetical protein